MHLLALLGRALARLLGCLACLLGRALTGLLGCLLGRALAGLLGCLALARATTLGRVLARH